MGLIRGLLDVDCAGPGFREDKITCISDCKDC